VKVTVLTFDLSLTSVFFCRVPRFLGHIISASILTRHKPSSLQSAKYKYFSTHVPIIMPAMPSSVYFAFDDFLALLQPAAT